MKKIILYRNGYSLLGSDQLMYVDGRYNLESTKEEVRKRNKRYEKHFNHLIEDGFRYCTDRLVEYGNVISI